MNAARVLAVGVSPTLEVTYLLPEAAAAGVCTAQAIVIEAGGKATNVARVLHQMGDPVLLLSGFAGLAGVALEAELQAEGLPYVSVPQAPPTRISTVLVSSGYEDAPTILRVSASATEDFGERVLAHAEDLLRIGAPDLLVLSGSQPHGIPDDFYSRAIARARWHGAQAFVDSTGTALLASAGAGADVVTPNVAELGETLQLSGTSTRDLCEGATRLHRLGARTVIVTCGRDGLLFVDSEGAWLVSLRPIAAVNAAGSGDGFLAGLVSGVLSGASIREAVPRACRWGAAAVLEPGSGRLPQSWPAEVTTMALRWMPIDA